MTWTADDAAKLAAFKTARDKLISGHAVAEASYSGFTTRFTAASITALEGEIEKLERQRDGKVAKRRGALGFRI